MADKSLELLTDGNTNLVFVLDQLRVIGAVCSDLNKRLESLEQLQGKYGNVVADSVDAQSVKVGGVDVMAQDGDYAPKNHASSQTTYGQATTSNYGHTKLSNDTLNANSTGTAGVACSTGHKHSQYLTQHQSLANYIQKSQTSGLIKNDGTVDTNTYLTSHQSVTDSSPTLSWGSTSKVGSVGNTDLHVTLPENPVSGIPVCGICSASWRSRYQNPQDQALNPLYSTRPILDNIIDGPTFSTTDSRVNLYTGSTPSQIGFPALCLSSSIGNLKWSYHLQAVWVFGSSPFVGNADDTRIMLTQSTAAPSSGQAIGYSDFAWDAHIEGFLSGGNGGYALPWGFRLASLNTTCVGDILWNVTVHWVKQ